MSNSMIISVSKRSVEETARVKELNATRNWMYLYGQGYVVGYAFEF